MKKNIIIISLLFLAFNLSALSKYKIKVKDILQIKHNGQTYNVSDNTSFSFDSEEFDLFFSRLKKEQAVSIYASTTYSVDPIPYYTGNFPVDSSKTIFAPGGGLAEYPLNPEEGYSLSVINFFNGFHYIYDERRINTKEGALLPVRKITDATGEYTNRIYLTFFIDFDNNSIIEENEIWNIDITFTNKYGKDFSENNRAYVSSMGYSVLTGDYDEKEFICYELHSTSNLNSFYKAEKVSFINRPPEYYIKWAKPDEVFSKEIEYVILLPKNYTFVNNPFRIKGDKTLYFEIKEIPEDEEKWCPIRTISVSKDKPLSSIKLYLDGKIIDVLNCIFKY